MLFPYSILIYIAFCDTCLDFVLFPIPWKMPYMKVNLWFLPFSPSYRSSIYSSSFIQFFIYPVLHLFLHLFIPSSHHSSLRASHLSYSSSLLSFKLTSYCRHHMAIFCSLLFCISFINPLRLFYFIPLLFQANKRRLGVVIPITAMFAAGAILQYSWWWLTTVFSLAMLALSLNFVLRYAFKK